jgi:hypothetical protein
LEPEWSLKTPKSAMEGRESLAANWELLDAVSPEIYLAAIFPVPVRITLAVIRGGVNPR